MTSAITKSTANVRQIGVLELEDAADNNGRPPIPKFNPIKDNGLYVLT